MWVKKVIITKKKKKKKKNKINNLKINIFIKKQYKDIYYKNIFNKLN